jgi:tRNA modification GTPase
VGANDSFPKRFPAEFGGAPEIVVASKVDLGPASFRHDHAVSSRTGLGIGELLDSIRSRFDQGTSIEDALVARERQRVELETAAVRLERAGAAAGEFAAEELRQALRALDRLVGRVDVEDVLDAIFGRFCIGK